MAKRKRAKAKRRSPSSASGGSTVTPKKSSTKRKKKPIPAGLSSDQYNRLLSRAETTRKRLRSYQNNPLYKDLAIPDPKDYLVKNLINRIEKGETNATILREMTKLVPDNFVPARFTAETGFSMPLTDYQRLQAAIKQANENIVTARDAYPPEVASVFPDLLDSAKLIQSLSNQKAYDNLLADMSLFVPENLQPIGNPDTGEAETKAEREYLTNILKRENERRQKLREEREELLAGTKQGFMRADESLFVNDIDLSTVKERDILRAKAETWSDSARIVRANLFITNHINELEKARGIFFERQMLSDRVDAIFDHIREIAERYYNHEDDIMVISTQIPDLEIHTWYDLVDGKISIDELVEFWDAHAIAP